jgi:hypothetical protein
VVQAFGTDEFDYSNKDRYYAFSLPSLAQSFFWRIKKLYCTGELFPNLVASSCTNLPKTPFLSLPLQENHQVLHITDSSNSSRHVSR